MLLLVALAINDIALALFYLQFAGFKTSLYRFQSTHRLLEIIAMDDDIIGIAFKLYFGMVLFYPFVKNIMQEDVCQ